MVTVSLSLKAITWSWRVLEQSNEYQSARRLTSDLRLPLTFSSLLFILLFWASHLFRHSVLSTIGHFQHFFLSWFTLSLFLSTFTSFFENLPVSASLISNLFHVLICLICFSHCRSTSSPLLPPSSFLHPVEFVLMSCDRPCHLFILSYHPSLSFLWCLHPSIPPSPSVPPSHLSLLPLSLEHKSEKGLFLFSHLRQSIKEARG